MLGVLAGFGLAFVCGDEVAARALFVECRVQFVCVNCVRVVLLRAGCFQLAGFKLGFRGLVAPGICVTDLTVFGKQVKLGVGLRWLLWRCLGVFFVVLVWR